jgi:hypothetical protein
MTRNAVPWKAVKIRKMKNDAKFGARAVPILKAKNSVALATETYTSNVSRRHSDWSNAFSIIDQACRRLLRTHFLP